MCLYVRFVCIVRVHECVLCVCVCGGVCLVCVCARVVSVCMCVVCVLCVCMSVVCVCVVVCALCVCVFVYVHECVCLLKAPWALITGLIVPHKFASIFNYIFLLCALKRIDTSRTRHS